MRFAPTHQTGFASTGTPKAIRLPARRRTWFALRIAACVATVATIIAAQPGRNPEVSAREWRHTDGRTITAALLGVERGSAVLRMAGNQRTEVPLSNLSESDRQWIETWKRDRTPEEALPPVNWPRVVTRPLPSIEGPVIEGTDFIFRTPHYQFVGDAELSIAAVQDFATVAEATWSLLRTWPLRAPDTGSTPLTARIYRDRDAYERAGGPPDSAGVFTGRFGRRGVLLVPFESIGIEAFQGHFTKSAAYRPRVLVHEMTHQIYAPVIRFLPLWLNEGLAEYVALIPYQNGTFRLDRDSMRHALAQRLADYKRRDPGSHGPFASSQTPRRNGLSRSPSCSSSTATMRNCAPRPSSKNIAPISPRFSPCSTFCNAMATAKRGACGAVSMNSTVF